jgi:phosphoglycerate dehydrogenase-like enzyme
MSPTRVLFIGFQDLVSACYNDFLESIGGKCPVSLYDPSEAIADQMSDVRVVVDQGGWGTHTMVDAARVAGIDLWQVIGTGVDHLDVKYILEKGITLANTPGIFSAVALAEHALFFIFCFAKNLHQSMENIRSGICFHPTNEELHNQTLGLIGFGASARELTKRASALGMRILAVDAAEVPRSVVDQYHLDFLGSPQDLPRLLAEADYLSLHAPLTSQTRHLVSDAAFRLMKPTAVLVNVARGGIVDEDALIRALQGGTIRGAGLDTFAHEPLDPLHPLLQMKNVIATPHVAGATRATSRRRCQAAAENVFRIGNGLPPLYQVTAVE